MKIKESDISNAEIFGLGEFLSRYVKFYTNSKKEKILENYDYFLEEASKKFWKNLGEEEKFKEQMKFFIKNVDIKKMEPLPFIDLYYFPPCSSDLNTYSLKEFSLAKYMSKKSFERNVGNFLSEFKKMLVYIPSLSGEEIRGMEFLKENSFPYARELSNLFDEYLWENSRETFNIQNLSHRGKIGKWIKDSRLSNTLAAGALMRKAEDEYYWDLKCKGYSNARVKISPFLSEVGEIKIAEYEKDDEASITVYYNPFYSGVIYKGSRKECVETDRRNSLTNEEFERIIEKYDVPPNFSQLT